MQLQYPLGPWKRLGPLSAPFKFMTMYLSICDTTETERQWLTRRRVVRTLFPQVAANPDPDPNPNPNPNPNPSPSPSPNPPNPNPNSNPYP